MTAPAAIGIGCTSTTTPQEILALLERVFAHVPKETTLATLDRRGEIVAVVAQRLQARLVVFTADELARISQTRSVAEAAALAAAGEGAVLVVPREQSARATCALARTP